MLVTSNPIVNITVRPLRSSGIVMPSAHHRAHAATVIV
jgi:hypothetical protein